MPATREAQQRDKDREILEYVKKHPIAREVEISEAVGLSRSATHARIVKLKKLKRLRSGMTVDLDALGFDHKYRIDITVNPRRLRRAIEAARAAIAAGVTTAAEIDPGKYPNQKAEWIDGKELFDAVFDVVHRWPDLTNHQEILAFHVLSCGERNPSILVEDVSVLLGDPADLCATIRVRAPQGENKKAEGNSATKVIYKLVTEDLRGLASVDSTSTCFEAWSCSHEFQKRLLEERPKRTRKPKTS
jgi:DNA-binding Lrp family transcriptional regulator